MEMKLKDKYGSVLSETHEMTNKWSKYFEGLLNADFFFFFFFFFMNVNTEQTQCALSRVCIL